MTTNVMRLLSAFKTILAPALILAAGLLLYGWARDNPQDLPWTKLDLGAPVGVFTGKKLAGLTLDPAGCRALLDEAGIAYQPLPDRSAGDHCGYRDGVRPLDGDDPQAIDYRPNSMTISCPVEAGLAMWEWNAVQPAALDLFGQHVARIEQLGGYGCRRMYGSQTGPWSEHATADALDIAAFVLEDGTRISVIDDWRGEKARAEFLHRVRDGACGLFATVLSPDYNEAHADHFHLDQAQRGRLSRRACR